jgi:alpha-D-xyloside xylohydrolase
MMDSVHNMHGRLMISVWPKYYPTTANFKELNDKGYIYQQALKDSVRDWISTGYFGSFYDAYSKKARETFWKQINRGLYSKGVDAWWMDASEPDILSNADIDYRKQLCGPTALGTSDKYFNTYALMNAEGIYEGQRGVNPNNRVFLLTRSGFAGLQRYSTATWSGDIGSRWEDMRAQMSAGLNYAMSGIPYWTMDIGGYCTEDRYTAGQSVFEKTGVENEDFKEWRELNSRWHQFAVFVPLYRSHGKFPLREPWNIAPAGHPAYESILYYDKLRYRLMPYIYTMAGMTYFKDYTIMRALVMDFSSDSKVNDIKDQWMFGPSMMACPVGYYKARTRNVYFPKQCGWYDLYTGKHISGGQTLNVDAPYERIPVFVREGSIVPFGPAMEWSDDKKPELINLYVYEGADASFQLYEDEGTNYNYEKGKFATIDFNYNEKTHKLTIGNRKGSFDGMLQKRSFNIVVISAKSAQPLNLDNPKGKLVKYNGNQITVKL